MAKLKATTIDGTLTVSSGNISLPTKHITLNSTGTITSDNDASDLYNITIGYNADTVSYGDIAIGRIC